MGRVQESIPRLFVGIAVLCASVLTGCANSGWQMGVDGSGYRVQCADGTWSNSGGRQGACSSHGGVGYSDESIDSSESQPEPEQRVPNLDVPNGFFDKGDGFAAKWIDEPTCPYSHFGCTAAEVYALVDCDLGGFANVNFLDVSGLVIETGIDSVPSMRAGDRAEVIFTSIDERVETTEMVDLYCSDLSS